MQSRPPACGNARIPSSRWGRTKPACGSATTAGPPTPACGAAGIPPPWGFRREAPLLAVEVAGRDENDMLLEKAGWYLAHGVPVVRLVVPHEREVIVVTAAAERRLGMSERLPPHPELPGLEPEVAELFRQVSRA